jgi:hypothetical protein
MLLLAPCAKAQCPPSSVPYPGSAWNGPYTIYETLPGGCVASVSFCERVENHGADALAVPDYYIESITPLTPPCSTYTPSQFLIATIASFESDPNVFPMGVPVPIPPCATNLTYQQSITSVANCFEMNYPPPPPPVINYQLPPFPTYYACPTASSYCVTTCLWCSTNNVPAAISCSSTDNFNNECQAAPSGGFDDPWVLGQCYNINPCSNN